MFKYSELMKKWDSVDQLITLERLKNNNLLNNGPQTPIFSEIRQVHCQTSLELMEKLEKKKMTKNPFNYIGNPPMYKVARLKGKIPEK